MSNEPGSGKSLALVIGNSTYQSVGFLENPRKDAAAMIALLKGLGFHEVIAAIDIAHTEFEAKLREFYAKLIRSETGLFFYAGHGVQVLGRNYLLPIDARINKASDLRTNAIKLDDIVHEMSRLSKTRLFFLDACRNDPISAASGESMRSLRSTPAIGSDIDDVSRGLAQIKAGAGTYVAYATEPGNVASDGLGENSPFTAALLQHVARPGLGLDDVMMAVRLDVLAATEGKQLPWTESGLTKRFQFTEGPAQAVSSDFQQEYWDRIKGTDNPDFLESFVRQFPEGPFTAEARQLLKSVTARREADDWEQAKLSGRIAALKDFVARYPNSARAGAARTKIFLRQLRRGSTILGLGLFAFVGTGAMLGLTFYGSPILAGTETQFVQFILVPSTVYCALLWFGLAYIASRRVWRLALALWLAAVPALIFSAGLSAAQRLDPDRKSYEEARNKAGSLQRLLAAEKSEPHADPVLISLREREVAGALDARLAAGYKLNWELRYYRLAAAAVSAIGISCTLLLSGMAISGRRQLGRWAVSIVGGALTGALGVLGLSSLVAFDPSLPQIISIMSWLSIFGFLALALAQTAGGDEALPTSIGVGT